MRDVSLSLTELSAAVAEQAERNHGYTGRRLARPVARPFLRLALRHTLANLPETNPEPHTAAASHLLEATAAAIEQTNLHQAETDGSAAYAGGLLIILLQIFLPVILRAFLEWLNARQENGLAARDLARRLKNPDGAGSR
jgi:hypothetical protein